MKIGDLAAKTGVAPRLLRYYEEVGILHPFRSGNGYRTYGEPAIDRVLQIRELLEAGFTTEMIREVLPCLDAAKEEAKAPVCPAIKDLDGLRRQLVSIERRIDVLQRNRHAIETYLRACEDAAAATPTASDRVPDLVVE
ncbi:MerR family transcriptional regulator [Planotetraspora kaengkrachanensis]|uniref:MerR family transcriptional regulator n=1 Tax=Planotetraspora kaengkrachanensis TaxID=575193 RepID=A0A8J3VCH8_9ACTN|nr:MerR family transcriptional regulator [Planotetraspora kaengkrachanensis]GIG84509.1 MerR family transcriptional regulator [Planotetraspora kaengkrachanensis]